MRRENSEEKFYCLSLSAMADLLSSRADAYARLYFRVRVLWDVAQRPVSTHLFFSRQHRALAGTFFFFIDNQEPIHSEISTCHACIIRQIAKI